MPIFLPINPAVAESRVKCLRVSQGFFGGSLLLDKQPYAARPGMVRPQPCFPLFCRPDRKDIAWGGFFLGSNSHLSVQYNGLK
jgi:hypothetical protein